MDPLTELRALLVEHGVEGDEVVTAVRTVLGERRAQRLDLARLEGERSAQAEIVQAHERTIGDLTAEVERMRPEADAGRQFRATVIEDALRSGVRAHGDHFERERYSGMFERMSIDEIRVLATDWERSASKRFPGGRQTTEGDESTSGRPTPRRAIPVMASRS